MRAHHVEIVGLLLHVADEVALGHGVVVAFVDDGDDRAGRHDAFVAALDDLGGLDDVLELADAALHVALLVLGGVVVAVLAEVAHQSGRFDLLGDLDSTAGGEVLELGLQSFVCGAGELRRRHREKTLSPRNISGHGLSNCGDRRRRHRPRGHRRGAEGRSRGRRRRSTPPTTTSAARATCATARSCPTRCSTSCAASTPSCSARSARPTCRPGVHRARPAAEDALRARPLRQPAPVRRADPSTTTASTSS